MRTVIRNGTVIAWMGERHRAIENGAVVFEDDRIVSAGPDEQAAADREIDATGRLVIPGLVNSHLHVTDTPYTKGFLEEVGSSSSEGTPTNFFALYKALPSVRAATDAEAQVAAAECAFAELALTGSTTVVELGYDFEIGGDGDISITERVADVAGRSGLRCYSGPRYRSRCYGDDNKGSVFYNEYGAKAQKRFEDCVEFCRTWNGRYDDRLRTMLAPGQIDTCEAQLLKDTRRCADELKIPIQLHAEQSPNEYARVMETENRTTVELMMETGLLGPDFIIGHGQIMSGDGDIMSMGSTKQPPYATLERRSAICRGSRLDAAVSSIRSTNIGNWASANAWERTPTRSTCSTTCGWRRWSARSSRRPPRLHRLGTCSTWRPSAARMRWAGPILAAWRRAARPTSPWSVSTHRKPRLSTIRSNF